MHFIWPHRKGLKDVPKIIFQCFCMLPQNYCFSLKSSAKHLLPLTKLLHSPLHYLTKYLLSLTLSVVPQHALHSLAIQLCFLLKLLSSPNKLCSHTKALKYSFIACPFTKVLQANAKVLWVNMFLRECKSIGIYFFSMSLVFVFFLNTLNKWKKKKKKTTICAVRQNAYFSSFNISHALLLLK